MQVSKKFLERVSLRGTPWYGRNFGPIAAFFRLVYDNLEFYLTLLWSAWLENLPSS